MSIINKISMMFCIASTSLTSCEAQVKNAKTETVKIFGNCGMCKTKIEKAGNLKNIAKVDWTLLVDFEKPFIDYFLQTNNLIISV